MIDRPRRVMVIGFGSMQVAGKVTSGSPGAYLQEISGWLRAPDARTWAGKIQIEIRGRLGPAKIVIFFYILSKTRVCLNLIPRPFGGEGGPQPALSQPGGTSRGQNP